MRFERALFNDCELIYDDIMCGGDNARDKILFFLCHHHYSSISILVKQVSGLWHYESKYVSNTVSLLVKEGYILALKSFKGELICNDKVIYALSKKGLRYVRKYLEPNVCDACAKALSSLYRTGEAKYAAHGLLASYSALQLLEDVSDQVYSYELPIENYLTANYKDFYKNSPFADVCIKRTLLGETSYINVEQDMDTCNNSDILDKVIRYYSAGVVGLPNTSEINIHNQTVILSCHDKTYVSRNTEVSATAFKKILDVVRSNPEYDLARVANSLKPELKDAFLNVVEFYNGYLNNPSIEGILEYHIDTLRGCFNLYKAQLVCRNEKASSDARVRYLTRALLQMLIRYEANELDISSKTVVEKILAGASFISVPTMLISKYNIKGNLGLIKEENSDYIKGQIIDAILGYQENIPGGMPKRSQCPVINHSSEAMFSIEHMQMIPRNTIKICKCDSSEVLVLVVVEDLSDVFAWIRAAFFLKYASYAKDSRRLVLIASKEEAARFEEFVKMSSTADMYGKGVPGDNVRFCFADRERYFAKADEDICFSLADGNAVFF